jgi:hypothetical protein
MKYSRIWMDERTLLQTEVFESVHGPVMISQRDTSGQAVTLATKPDHC